MENYIDNIALQNAFLLENGDHRSLIASVDKDRVEQDILKDGEPAFQPFASTYEAVEHEHSRDLEEDDKDLIEQIHGLVQGSKAEARRSIKMLQKLKRKYPNIPTIYNFISVAYATLDNEKKRYHTIKMTCKVFPHYLFGKITLAEHKISYGDFEDIPEVFDHKLQLYMHYPDAELNAEGIPTFHASEVQAFYATVAQYYIRKNQLARALKCYFLVESANRESPYLHGLAGEIMIAEVSNKMLGSITEAAAKSLGDE
ncbi:MAG: hypothetical protein Q9N02_07755 [Ghiorsea sp.]|nr:hypothetical protein [Ghiorsea sp.]